MLRSIWRNSTLRQVLAASAFFAVVIGLADIIIGPGMSARIVNALAIAVAVGVLTIYGSIIIRAFRKEMPDNSDLLTLGIGFIWLATFGFRTYYALTIYGWTGATRDPSHWPLAFAACVFVAGYFHVAATGKLKVSIPTVRGRVIFAAAIVAALLFGFAIGAQT